MKAIIKFKGAFLLIVVVYCALYGGPTTIEQHIEHKKAILICGDQNIQCTVAILGAVGDPINIDVSKYKVTDLGKISSEKEVTVELPKDVGTQTVYSFTPTTGESKDRLIYFVFDNIKHRPGSRLFGTINIRMGRRFADEDPKKWVEVGNILAPKLETTKAVITIKPDGTAVWIDPNKEPRVFQIGKKNLR